MPPQACLQRQREWRWLGFWGLGRGICGPQAHSCVVRASPSPLAHKVDGEDPRCPSLRPFPCSQPGLGSLSPGGLWSEAPSSAGQPEPPPCSVTLADAFPLPTRLCPEPHPEQRWEPRCSHSLALDQLRKITDPAFLSPPLSGERMDSALEWPQVPILGARHPLPVHVILV